MSVWLLLVALAVVKLPLAGLLLWLTLRSDEAMTMREGSPAAAADGGRDEDGGSKTPPRPGSRPRRPSPFGLRRGPHGSPPASPSRVRGPARRVVTLTAPRR